MKRDIRLDGILAVALYQFLRSVEHLQVTIHGSGMPIYWAFRENMIQM